MTQENEFVLAVDGGGTKTNVVCAALDGTVVGEGVSGPTNLTSTTPGAASFNLREAVRQATQPLAAEARMRVMVMGLAGMDNIKEHDTAAKSFAQVIEYFKIEKFDLVNDVIIALENGTDDPNAVVLISGTGSNCFARTEHGETAKAGGMDFLLTDEGSGYAIGRNILRAAVRSFDGRGRKSVLEELVCQHFEIESIHDLKTVVYNPLLTKIEVAQLAPLCFEAHDEGDEIACEILTQTVADLHQMVLAVSTRLHLHEMTGSIVLSGSILQQPSILEPLSGILHTDIPGFSQVSPETPPVHGALKMALKMT